jgi:lipid-A-disaccharide synthase
MHKRGIPVVYYVCPQFWAWRQGRVRLLRKYVDNALVIFPFEEPFYRDRGVEATFIGHPLADTRLPLATREEYAREHGLDAAKTWIVLMPGSRVKEVGMNLPTILEAATKLGAGYEFLLPVAPTVEKEFIQKLIAAGLRVTLVPEAKPAMRHAKAGIIASGTATIEAALMELPFVMVYRVSPLTYLLGRPRIKVPHFAMVNLVAGEEIVPELVQNAFTAESVVSALKKILPFGDAREQMIRGLRKVKEDLRPRGTVHPADAAAEIILRMAKPAVSRTP